MRNLLLVLVAAAVGAAAAPLAAQETSSSPQWRVYGDYRFRAAMDRERRAAPDRERIRLRLRLGADVDLIEGLRVGARLSTAPEGGAPNSPYVDLGDGFDRARFRLDRMFIRWQPKLGEERPLSLWGGKFANPLRQPAHYSESLWDADLHPEGIAATYEPIPELRIAAGGFSVLNRGGASDVNLAVAQAAVRLSPAPDWQVDAALGGYFYGTIDASAAAALAGSNRGNALVRDAAGDVVGFASGFDVWQTHAGVTYSGLSMPVSVAGEYFVNASAAAGTDDTGHAFSARVGSLSDPGNVQVTYRYQDIGPEATFSSFVQDDFLDAVGYDGHIISATVQLLSFARLRAWTLWSRAPGESDLQRRYRLDFDLSWSMP